MIEGQEVAGPETVEGSIKDQFLLNQAIVKAKKSVNRNFNNVYYNTSDEEKKRKMEGAMLGELNKFNGAPTRFQEHDSGNDYLSSN